MEALFSHRCQQPLGSWVTRSGPRHSDESLARMLARLEGVPSLISIWQNKNDGEAIFSLAILMRAGYFKYNSRTSNRGLVVAPTAATTIFSVATAAVGTLVVLQLKASPIEKVAAPNLLSSATTAALWALMSLLQEQKMAREDNLDQLAVPRWYLPTTYTTHSRC